MQFCNAQAMVWQETATLHCSEVLYMLVLQLRFLFWSMLFFILCVSLLFFVKLNSCSSFVETWLGFAPLYVRNRYLLNIYCLSGMSELCLRYKSSVHMHVLPLTIQNHPFPMAAAGDDHVDVWPRL